MTFGEKLAQAAENDPAFGRSMKRLRIASLLFGVGLLLALVLALWGLVIGFGNSTEITNVTKKVESPCQRAEESHRRDKEATAECDHLRAEIARHEPIENSCIPFQRASGERGANCQRFYVPRNGSPMEGGDAHQTPSTTQQQPGPPSSGSPGGTSEGTKQPPTSSNPPSHPESVAEETDTPPATTPEEVPAQAEPEPPHSEPAGLLTPVLEGVCSVANHVAHLC